MLDDTSSKPAPTKTNSNTNTNTNPNDYMSSSGYNDFIATNDVHSGLELKKEKLLMMSGKRFSNFFFNHRFVFVFAILIKSNCSFSSDFDGFC